MLLANRAHAELPPGAYEELKAKATDVLTVKITKVEKKDTGNSDDMRDVIYTAEVTKVERSKSGRKVGDSIKIGSYRLKPGVELAGPKIPPLLKSPRMRPRPKRHR